jgi:L-ascorbate metabolism protein UlaG (beta-lactamase superfamily)
MSDRITFVGHATVLIEIGGRRILTDPVLRPRMLRIIHRHADEPADHVTEDVDAVLISHLHHDHLDFPSLKRFDRTTRIVVPAGAARTIRRRGFTEVAELAAGERAEVGGVQVAATAAVHAGRRFKVGPMVRAVGYEVSAGSSSIYFAGDPDLFDEMAELAGRIDVALLPIAGWGPKLGKGHLNPKTAAEAAALIRPRVVIPIHWGTLLRSDLRKDTERWFGGPPREFANALAERAPGVELCILQPGESLDLPAGA